MFKGGHAPRKGNTRIRTETYPVYGLERSAVLRLNCRETWMPDGGLISFISP